MKIIHKKGNLFKDLNTNIIYLHSCNAQGHWGAGIATQFKSIFPKSFLAHAKRRNKPGDGYIVKHDDFDIACLITSEFYGKRKDPPKKILVQTYLALQNLFASISEEEVTIYSPKINSGFFATPWYATEKVIVRACEKMGKKVNWVVWEK